MEDLELRQLLRRYVETGEPPFSLTASALIAQARRRQRWRTGLGIGGGGAATTLAIVSAIALVPTAGPGLDPARSCDVELRLGPSADYRPWDMRHSEPSPPSSIPPVDPRGGAPSGSPLITPPAAPAIPSGSVEITPKLPTNPPSAPHSAEPEPSGRPPDPATPNPPGSTPLPGGTLPTRDWVRPRILDREVDQARIDEMSCFLKRRLVELLPTATYYSPTPVPPMQVTRRQSLVAEQWVYVYGAIAYMIDGQLLCKIIVWVYPSEWGYEPYRHFAPREDFDYTLAVVKTKASTIVVAAEGPTLTQSQAMELAHAPELDLYS